MLVAALSDTSVAVIVGVATAIGAGVGGAIAGFGTWLVDRRRENRERLGQEEVQTRDLKEAARLVDEELRAATDLIRDAVYQGRWWPAPRELSAAIYARYRNVLAVSLGDAEWSDVSLAFQELNRVNGERRKGIPSLQDVGGVGDPMNPLDRVDLLSVGQAVIEARFALAPAAAPPDKVALLRDGAEATATAVFPVPEELDEELAPLVHGDDSQAEDDEDSSEGSPAS